MTEKQAADLNDIEKEIADVSKEIILLSSYTNATKQLLSLLETLYGEICEIYKKTALKDLMAGGYHRMTSQLQEINNRAKVFGLEVQTVEGGYTITLHTSLQKIINQQPLTFEVAELLILLIEQSKLGRKIVWELINGNLAAFKIGAVRDKARQFGLSVVYVNEGYLLIDTAKNCVATRIIFSSIDEIADWLADFEKNIH